MTCSDSESDKETARDRVRRLVLDPLTKAGMRFRHRTPQDDQAKWLNALCDELSYCNEKTLQAIASWAKCHGDGAGRSFWPSRVAFLSTAEAYQPRRLEEVPVIASWFGSVAGPAAQDAGRLVAEFRFIERMKRPPLQGAKGQREWAAIEEEARDYQRRVELSTDRITRNVEVGSSERQFLGWYFETELRALALVEAGEQKRQSGVAA